MFTRPEVFWWNGSIGQSTVHYRPSHYAGLSEGSFYFHFSFNCKSAVVMMPTLSLATDGTNVTHEDQVGIIMTLSFQYPIDGYICWTTGRLNSGCRVLALSDSCGRQDLHYRESPLEFTGPCHHCLFSNRLHTKCALVFLSINKFGTAAKLLKGLSGPAEYGVLCNTSTPID